MKLYICDPNKNTECRGRFKTDFPGGCGADCRYTMNPAFAVAGSVPVEFAPGKFVIGVLEKGQGEPQCKK